MSNFGIIVSGGPAPGINSVISSAVRNANKENCKIYGISGGFKGIVTNLSKAIQELDLNYCFSNSNLGGSILGTSRFNLFEQNENLIKFKQTLKEFKISRLIIIGGEGSAYISNRLSQTESDIQVAHVPKTIDNDLILPNQHPSFGFETARFVGTNLLKTLMSEARTTKRWFIVKSMGRRAGFLALGLGVASGAALTLVAEEFEQNITPEDVAKKILKSIKKRLANDKNYGCTVIAEGILDKFDRKKVPELKNISRDELGRLRLSEANLEGLVVSSLRTLLEKEGIDIRINPENIGYEMRCADPISFDLEYTRFLGYGAVKFLLEGHSGFMVVRDFDRLKYVPLSEMAKDNYVIKSRSIDLNSDLYQVARSLMDF